MVNAGRNKKYPDLTQRFRNLPLTKRWTVWEAAAALNIPRLVIQDRMQSGELIQVNSTAKPSLTDNNKVWRLEFVT